MESRKLAVAVVTIGATALVAIGKLTAVAPSGTVTDSGGNPVRDVYVLASTTDFSVSRAVYTDATGHYAIKGLGSGGYTVQFQAPQGTNLAPQYYDQKDSSTGAAVVAATVGQTISGIDAKLHTGARVSGTVTDAVSHQPLGNVDVQVYADSFGLYTRTAADGTFTIDGLPAGTASFYVRDPSGYHRTPSSRTLTLTLGQTVNGDTALDPAGAIAGTVTDKATGDPIADITVTLFRAGNVVASMRTDALGRYAAYELVPGTYQASFTSFASGSGYATQFYDGVATLAAATPVTVTAGATTPKIDASLVAVVSQPGICLRASNVSPVSKSA